MPWQLPCVALHASRTVEKKTSGIFFGHIACTFVCLIFMLIPCRLAKVNSITMSTLLRRRQHLLVATLTMRDRRNTTRDMNVYERPCTVIYHHSVNMLDTV